MHFLLYSVKAALASTVLFKTAIAKVVVQALRCFEPDCFFDGLLTSVAHNQHTTWAIFGLNKLKDWLFWINFSNNLELKIIQFRDNFSRL